MLSKFDFLFSFVSLGDSLDLVPIGAFHGRGKRAGLSLFIYLFFFPSFSFPHTILKSLNFPENLLKKVFLVPFYWLVMMTLQRNISQSAKLVFQFFLRNIFSTTCPFFQLKILPYFFSFFLHFFSGTGFSEVILEELSTSLKKSQIEKPPVRLKSFFFFFFFA